jgi:hypothetical protein
MFRATTKPFLRMNTALMRQTRPGVLVSSRQLGYQENVSSRFLPSTPDNVSEGQKEKHDAGAVRSADLQASVGRKITLLFVMYSARGVIFLSSLCSPMHLATST